MEDKSQNSDSKESNQIESQEKKFEFSQILTNNEVKNDSLGFDHIGIEIISVAPASLIKAVSILKKEGFNYLECQGGYDEGPGKRLVSFYHFIAMENLEDNQPPREVRIKVFLSRDSDLSIPSLYSLFKGSDWQERETFDMFGINYENHPCPKRLLMPEDWKGWPLRKDYIQPDFYELQDAY
tara:strand:+ start:1072 stop:1617 length:546 start_codon:yes stop_codon:yes gene_type:complete